MADEHATVKCGNCQLELTESASTPIAERQPCPKCGSSIRAFELKITSTVSVKSKIAARAKRPGIKKPFYELISGDDLFRLSGQWNTLTQVIDRARNYYLKIVTDPRSGTVIRYCEEPLDEHQNRVYAKYKKGEGNA
ncbi:MAG: zinc ribbon domain-containing protein [Pseudomonadota bacterium]